MHSAAHILFMEFKIWYCTHVQNSVEANNMRGSWKNNNSLHVTIGCNLCLKTRNRQYQASFCNANNVSEHSSENKIRNPTKASYI